MIETQFSKGKLSYLCHCDKCGDTTLYKSQAGANKNATKCLFCRRKEPKSEFGRYYRRWMKNCTPAIKRWSKHNLENMRIKQGFYDTRTNIQ